MRCFYVLVHGKLDWIADSPEPGIDRPPGFYCYRYVLALAEQSARRTAFRRVRENLDRQTGWIANGLARLELEAEEVRPAPIHKILFPDNRGHSFYEGDCDS